MNSFASLSKYHVFIVFILLILFIGNIRHNQTQFLKLKHFNPAIHIHKINRPLLSKQLLDWSQTLPFSITYELSPRHILIQSQCANLEPLISSILRLDHLRILDISIVPHLTSSMYATIRIRHEILG